MPPLLLLAGAVVIGGVVYMATSKKKKPEPGEAPDVTVPDVDERPKNYWLPQAPGMPDELYTRYEECMQGSCDIDTMTALAEELYSLGYGDHGKDIDEFISDIQGEPLTDPPLPETPKAPVGDTAVEVANIINSLPSRDELCELDSFTVKNYQSALGAPQSGYYDYYTAVAMASHAVLPRYAPCDMPLSPQLEQGLDTAIDALRNALKGF